MESEYLKEELKLLNNFDEIIGQSKPVMKLLHDISLVAKTDSTVLISGEQVQVRNWSPEQFIRLAAEERNSL